MRRCLWLFLAACAPAPTTSPAPAESASGLTTYHEHVRPILEERCVSCHASEGIGPFALDGYEAAKAVAMPMRHAVETRAMPPWFADSSCRSYVGDLSLPEVDIAAIAKWVEDGRPEGDPAKYAARAAPLETSLGPPSLTLRADEPYAPRAERLDDYRCFPLAHRFEEETYLLTTSIKPDRADLVHHVIVYMVPAHSAPQLEALDAADPEPGYACFGGIGIGSPELIAGWAPGNKMLRTNRDAGIRIPKGARLVMQMHYNVLGAAPAPDRTELLIWLLDQRPSYLVFTRPLAHLGIDIAAGDAASRQVRTFHNTSRAPWSIWAVSPHMHLLGTKLKLTAVHAGGEECLLDMREWRFGWQRPYQFEQPAAVLPGESIRLECTYDNSAAKQPAIGGTRAPPKRVNWGEGTFDEMCLAYITTVEPYAPAPAVGEICRGFQPCYDTCRTGAFGLTTSCTLQCASADGPACSECAIAGLIQCGLSDCPLESARLVECLQDCQRTGGASCVANRCLDAIFGFNACVQPVIDAGKCESSVAGCGVRL